MKIEEGKKYRTAMGDLVTGVTELTNPLGPYSFKAHVEGFGWIHYTDDGRWQPDIENLSGLDITKEEKQSNVCN